VNGGHGHGDACVMWMGWSCKIKIDLNRCTLRIENPGPWTVCCVDPIDVAEIMIIMMMISGITFSWMNFVWIIGTGAKHVAAG
jgi:hypothetical protein